MIVATKTPFSASTQNGLKSYDKKKIFYVGKVGKNWYLIHYEGGEMIKVTGDWTKFSKSEK